jgi:hypothetical protein
MAESKLTEKFFAQHGEKPEDTIEGSIKGYSNMPFWNHDLKLKAVMALLGTVDYKDFYENNNPEDLEQYLNEIEEQIKHLRGL